MNGRSLKQNIEIINERVRLINKKLGTKFYASYDTVWKVWTMYEIDENGAHCNNCIGFDAGKTMDEMYAYTDGIFRFWDFMRYNSPNIEKW
jgi:hypothetical protein